MPNWIGVPINETNNYASVDFMVSLGEQRNIKSAENKLRYAGDMSSFKE